MGTRMPARGFKGSAIKLVHDHSDVVARRQRRMAPMPQDRIREHGALANPGGRPNRINAA